MLTIRHHRPYEAPVKKVKKEKPKLKVVATPKVEEIKRPVLLSEKLIQAEKEVTDKFNVDIREVYGKSRRRPVVEARRHFIQILHHKVGWGSGRISEMLNIDRTSVLHHLGLRKSSKTAYGALKDK